MSGTNTKVATAEQLIHSGRLKQAEEHLRRALRTAPNDLGLVSCMAALLSRTGPLEQAVYFARKAVSISPGSPLALGNLAVVLFQSGLLAEAAEAARKQVELDPAGAWARTNLASILSQMGRPQEALDAATGSTADLTDHAELANLAGHALVNIGRADEALPMLLRARQKHPTDARIASCAAVACNYCPGVTAEQSQEIHRDYGRLLDMFNEGAGVAPPVAEAWTPGGRKLRVGFISPDLNSHSVAFFIEPLLAHLDRGKFALSCFAMGREDATTARLRAYGTGWHHLGGLDMVAIADRVRGERIDVLIELCGHFLNNALPAMARRAAPVQATYIGYPSITGVRQIDYRITDSIADPPGERSEAGAGAAERFARLDPCFLCFRPPDDLPKVGRREGTGPVTFGSFNTLQKLNGATLDLWARVMTAAPGSRLLLKASGLQEAGPRRRILERLGAGGIVADRVEMHDRVASQREHLGLYDRMDVALDPVPYNGTTTTCEALAMGVPVVTLRGGAHAGRVGSSLLTAVGLPELIAESEAEFVARAAGLAGDTARLAELRAKLRERLVGSVLCDGPGFAERFGRVLMMMAGEVLPARRGA